MFKKKALPERRVVTLFSIFNRFEYYSSIQWVVSAYLYNATCMLNFCYHVPARLTSARVKGEISAMNIFTQ